MLMMMRMLMISGQKRFIFVCKYQSSHCVQIRTATLKQVGFVGGSSINGRRG